MAGPLNKVIILGAGASVPAGAPTMLGFLDRARDLRRHGLPPEYHESFDAVLDSLRDLAGIYEKAYLNLDNLEEVFGAIERAELVGKLADMSSDKIKRLRSHFVQMVVRTLQLSITVAANDRAPAAASTLAQGIASAIKKGVNISVITFNYDLVMEMALRTARLGHFYALPGEERPENRNVIPVLKLHGSINWHFCEPCKVVYDANTFSHAYQPHGEGRLVGLLDHPQAHRCNRIPDQTPIIVPPSWDKSRYQSSLRNVWEQAAIDLGNADEIFVIGYSLPEADSFFRYLFALGTQSRTRVQRMLVVNPDRDVRPKFERFIGQGLRPQLQFAEDGLFQNAVSQINAMLQET